MKAPEIFFAIVSSFLIGLCLGMIISRQNDIILGRFEEHCEITFGVIKTVDNATVCIYGGTLVPLK
jgi:hypothetical protein